MRSVAVSILTVSSLIAQSDLRRMVEGGQYRRAHAAAEERLKANPKDSEAHYAVSLALYRAGDLERSLPPAEKAVALSSKDAEYHSHLAQVVGSLAQRASVFRQLGLAKRCRSELEAAIAIDPKHFEANLTLMLFLLKAPSLFGGDKDRARMIPETIAKYDPSNGFMARARLAREENPKARVSEFYRNAIEANPKNLRAQVAYLSSLNEAGNFEEVERRARRLIELFPNRHEGYSFLAARYAAIRRWDELESVLRESQKQCPDNLSAYLSVARTLLSEGKELKRAEDYLKVYLSKQPEYGETPHFQTHWLLGLVFEKQARMPDAIAQMERALKLNASFEPAKKDLKRLRS
jgi:tetratricopeptide (TPR) repeat protein